MTRKFFAISAMVEDGKLHDVLTMLEMIGGSYQMQARPVPVEASNAMLRQAGELVEAARAKPAPALPAGKPKKKTRDPGTRSTPEFHAQAAATKMFLDEHPKFHVSDYEKKMLEVAPTRPFDYKSRLQYYVTQGRLRKTGDGNYERIEQ